MLTSLVAAATVATMPNIVYIMADDLGYGDLGCYGQAKIPTPNIDRLASEGIKMTRFYAASPVCAPTRAFLMTGKHQGHSPVRGNKERGDFTFNGIEGQFPLPKSETTIAEMLKAHGYATGLVGKWGLGSPVPGEHPLDHGFDRFYGYLCQRRAHNHYPAYLWSDHQPELLSGNRPYNAHQRLQSPLASESEYAEQFSGGTYAGERMVEEAVKFLRTSKNKPFFLYYAPVQPHVALQAPPEWIEKFPRNWDEKPYLGQNGYLPHPRPRAAYAAMIAYLDHTVGQIMDEVERQGKTENTLFVFTSDNGAVRNAGGADLDFFNSNGGLRAGKMSLYEGGIRVPAVLRWPGKIEPGTKTETIATAYDVMSTIAEATGIRAPKNDGRSFLGSLIGKPVRNREYAYFEYPEASVMQAIIYSRYKAIRPKLNQDAAAIEIYDLQSDPNETIDLASQRPDLVKEALADMAREHVPNAVFPLRGVDKS